MTKVEILIRNIKRSKLEDIEGIKVYKKEVVIDNEHYYRVVCSSPKKLIKLLRQYPEDIKNSTNNDGINTFFIKNIFKDIIQWKDFEIFKIYIDIFELKDYIAYAYNPDFIEAKDSRIFTYYLNYIILEMGFHRKIEYLKDLLIQDINYKNDEYCDKYIEIMECIEANLEKKEIKIVLSEHYINFDTRMRKKIQNNNYNCIHTMITYMRKYFPSVELNYGSAIATSICYNKLEFTDMFIDFYHQDIQDNKELDSDIMIEIFPDEYKNKYSGFPKIKESETSIKLESLQYLYEKNMKGQFYSKTVIQLIIICSVQSNDEAAFAYMINVFPYEAMSLIEEIKSWVYKLHQFPKFYKQIEELYDDFDECIM